MSSPAEPPPAGLRRPQLVLVARDAALADAWRTVAGGRPGVEVHRGSIFDVRADAYVSPANSAGRMEGGIDQAYVTVFGRDLAARVEATVRDRPGGELPVGEAAVVATGTVEPAWLVVAPTMRQPGRLPPGSRNAYLAMRAVLRVWEEGSVPAAGRATPAPVRSVVTRIAVPGLGTGTGRLDPARCAAQVAEALDEFTGR